MGPLKFDWIKAMRELANRERTLEEVVERLREIDPTFTMSYEIPDFIVFSCAPDKREAIEAALGDHITWFREE